MKRFIAMVAVVLLVCCGVSVGEQRFSDLVGPVTIGEVTNISPLQVPYILWGGDMATFYANGGLKTESGTIFAKQGLNLNLVGGDDFVQQVRNYMSGKSPFLRGTYRMIGMASEVIGSDPRTKPHMICQLTWSAGDHCVSRAGIRTIADLKGKKVALQTGGPHVGMLDDILKTAGLTWNDIIIEWCKDLTESPDSPAAKFKADTSIAACFVVTPDMIGLTGGLQTTGSGYEETVKGARVLVSTAELSYSIADVYVVRSDFWQKNSSIVTKFVAGLLKAQEEVIDLKKAYEATGSQKYLELCKMGNQIYNFDFPAESEDGSLGLLMDCTFVGHPGNIAFFADEKNQHGFEVFQKKSLDLAVSRGYAKVRQGIFPSPIDWNSSEFIGYLSKTGIAKRAQRFDAEAVYEEIEALSSGGSLDEKTILSFSINFAPNQTKFSASQYGVDYERVIEALGKFGNAVIAIRGHADPTKMLLECVRAGKAKKIIRSSGSGSKSSYSLNGRPLNLEQTGIVIQLIKEGKFDGVANHNPREIMEAARNLSRLRAEKVRDSIIDYAKNQHSLDLDPTQIQPVGVGVREPFIAKPKNLAEAGQNRRVEFSLVRVNPEVINPSDFDF